ncbi:MAG: hypothetical protein V9G19_17225 [Tetrasphaera sp.]
MQRRKFITGAAAAIALAGAPMLATAGGAHAVDTDKAAGWSSSFNSNSRGWSSVRGSWYRSAGKWRADGQPGYFLSTKHTGVWENFVYQAKVKRDGNGGGTWANALIVRANPGNLRYDYRWLPGYYFQFTNTGYFSVWYMDASGGDAAVKDWTYSSVVENAYWKNMKVVANDGYLSFSINGYSLWSGYDYRLSYGKVGVGFYTASGYWGKLQIDQSSLQTLPGRAKVTPDPSAPIGATVPGGTILRSPK